MARIVIIFSLCLVAACDVGELPGLTGDGAAGDGTGNGCVPVAAAASIPVGHHNPPMVTGCMSAAGCHNEALGLGTAAPAYTYAGMLYKADKVTPYGGATIVVKRGVAQAQTIVSDNGEFAMVGGAGGIDAPTNEMTGTTSASGCPNVAPMVTPLVLGSGDCNKGGCHTPGMAQGAIYLQ